MVSCAWAGGSSHSKLQRLGPGARCSCPLRQLSLSPDQGRNGSRRQAEGRALGQAARPFRARI